MNQSGLLNRIREHGQPRSRTLFIAGLAFPEGTEGGRISKSSDIEWLEIQILSHSYANLLNPQYWLGLPPKPLIKNEWSRNALVIKYEGKTP